MSVTFNVSVLTPNFKFAGGDTEFEPFFQYYATWGTNLIPKRTPSLERSTLDISALSLDYTSPHAHPHESIWVTILANSRVSGDPLKDPHRSRVVRVIECGTIRVPVDKLLHHTLRYPGKKLSVSLPLYDSRLGRYKSRTAGMLLDRGTVQVEFLLSSYRPAQARAYLEWCKGKSPYSPSQYGPIEDLLRIYASYFMSDDCRYPPHTNKLSHLHMALFVSEAGVQPPMGYWQNDVHTRIYRSDAEKRHYQKLFPLFSGSLKTHIRGLIKSQLTRQGMLVPEFISICTKQKESPSSLMPLFRICVDVVLQAASSVVLNVPYTSDFRINPNTKKVILIDSFDSLLEGIRTSDDCEGLAQAIANTLYIMQLGSKVWLSEPGHDALWAAVYFVLQHYTIFNGGSLATTSYIGQSAPGDADIEDLPVRGSAQDTDRGDIGHLHGWAFTNTKARDLYTRGNVSQQQIATMFPDPSPPFEAELPSCVFEGTGTTDVFQSTLEESMGGIQTESFKWSMLRQIALSEVDKIVGKSLMARFDTVARPFYFYKHSAAGRRTSFFYDKAGHAVMMNRHNDTPALSQVTFVNADDTYGVPVEQLFGPSTDENKHERPRFIAPYAESLQFWEENIRPYMSSIQHQLPLSIYSNFSAEQAANLIPEITPLYSVSGSVDVSYRTSGTITVVLFLKPGYSPQTTREAMAKILEKSRSIVQGNCWYTFRPLPQVPTGYELHLHISAAGLVKKNAYARDVMNGHIPKGM
jgi:hypothetical protein